MLDAAARSGEVSVANETGVGETLSSGMSFVVGASRWPSSCCQATDVVFGSTATRYSRSVWTLGAPYWGGLRSYSKRITKTTRSPSSAGDETACRLLANEPGVGAAASGTWTGQPASCWPVVAS